MKTVVSDRTAYVFGIETISSAWREAEKLFYRHHTEVGAFDGKDFRPSRKLYERLDAAGALGVYTMRKDGELVGYGLFHLAPHPQYPDTRWANCDALYVLPWHRGKITFDFLRYVETSLKEDHAVDKWVIASPLKQEIGGLLKHCGFRAFETAWVKEL